MGQNNSALPDRTFSLDPAKKSPPDQTLSLSFSAYNIKKQNSPQILNKLSPIDKIKNLFSSNKKRMNASKGSDPPKTIIHQFRKSSTSDLKKTFNPEDIKKIEKLKKNLQTYTEKLTQDSSKQKKQTAVGNNLAISQNISTISPFVGFQKKLTKELSFETMKNTIQEVKDKKCKGRRRVMTEDLENQKEYQEIRPRPYLSENIPTSNLRTNSAEKNLLFMPQINFNQVISFF